MFESLVICNEETPAQAEETFWAECMEVFRLGKLYGLLDGTISTSREQAITANKDFMKEFSRV